MANLVSGSINFIVFDYDADQLVPSAGADRLYFVGQSMEEVGQNVADRAFDSVVFRGETASVLQSAFAAPDNARGLKLFVFTESQIQAIEAGSGDIEFYNNSNPATFYGQVFCFTLENCAQALPTTYSVANLNTNGGDPFPHELTITGAEIGEFAFLIAHMSQPEDNNWAGATEVLEQQAGVFSTTLASHDVVADGDVVAGVTSTSGASYATAIIGILVDSPVVGNSDPVLDSPINDIVIGLADVGSTDISGNFSDADLDSLTYSAVPALPSGVTLDANTGVISWDGSQVITAAADYTFSADDGQGGAPASDVVSVSVAGPSIANIDLDNIVQQGQTGVVITLNNPQSISSIDSIDIGGNALSNIQYTPGSATVTVDIPVGTPVISSPGDDLTINYQE